MHPLVILLHGHGGSAAQLLGLARGAAPLSVWLRIADREGLLVAAPDGVKGPDGRQGWNDCRTDAPGNPRADDVGFINAIMAREIADHQADPRRVFVMGMSNGGMMAFRMAVESGKSLAGFAAVSASMAQHSDCPKPASPLSALIVSGTADPLVPYRGGEVRLLRADRGAVIGVEEAAALWRELDGLPTAPSSVFTYQHREANDPTTATRTLWGDNGRGVQVELLRIDQGGHVEPSMTQRVSAVYSGFVGPQNADLEIAEEAWQFFANRRSNR